MKKLSTFITLALLAGSVAGCEGYGRPELEPMAPSITNMQQQGTSLPMMAPQIPTQLKSASGSLWQPGSKQFFRDPRANNIGDIMTIIVSEQANATTEANTETTHEQDSNSSLGSLLGIGNKILPKVKIGAANLANSARANEFTGEGTTDRSDELTARIAAVVTHKLPNGYLVIEGRREVLLNYEKQILTIKGVVRPEDVAADNTISSDKVAEARIAYVGRGILDEVQNAPSGARFFQRWLPF